MTGYPPEKTRTAADELYAKADSADDKAEKYRQTVNATEAKLLRLVAGLSEEERSEVEADLNLMILDAHLWGAYRACAERWREKAREA